MATPQLEFCANIFASGQAEQFCILFCMASCCSILNCTTVHSRKLICTILNCTTVHSWQLIGCKQFCASALSYFDKGHCYWMLLIVETMFSLKHAFHLYQNNVPGVVPIMFRGLCQALCSVMRRGDQSQKSIELSALL